MSYCSGVNMKSCWETAKGKAGSGGQLTYGFHGQCRVKSGVNGDPLGIQRRDVQSGFE